jgi:hypothetical protein
MDLTTWQLARLERLRNLVFSPARRGSVTVVIYHFWELDQFDRQFDAVECAIYETWLHCGLLKTCLVMNRMTPRVEQFLDRHGNAVGYQLNTALIPGDIPSMSADCNANLHRYFDTDEVLVIQNDGYPLRAGLEEFTGRYDYVGAPFLRRTRLNQITGLWPRFAVGNGGFSLRSKRICEMASFYWTKRYRRFPRDWRLLREDAFYCVLLPLLEKKYRRNIRIAPLDIACRFSHDRLYGDVGAELPFGFHGARAFQNLVDSGLLNLDLAGRALDND